MIGRVVFALMVGGAIAPGASAQDAPPKTSPPAVYATPQAPPVVTSADVPPPPPTPAALPARKAETAVAAQKSIARQNPLPTRTTAFRDSSPISRLEALSEQGRFANPGGVGKVAEYYTPNTPMGQSDPQPMRLAGFDRGGGPNRAEQIAAFRAGQMRTRNIQNNINAYGRPYGAYGAGFGYGLGLGGVGRGYGGFY